MIRLVFMGTPQFATPILQELINDPEINVALVVTQPDKPIGRSQEVVSPPVKETAQKAGLTIIQPDNVNGDDVATMIAEARPDFIVVVAYGQILKQNILKLPKKEILNVHASLLPKLRGASPIQSAILSGDDITGVSIMGIRKKMDTGPVYLEEEVSIDNKNLTDLSEELTHLGSKALIKVLKNFDTLTPEEQDDNDATYCRKIKKNDGEISFQEMDADEIDRCFRAFHGWPGIFTYYDEKRLVLSEIIKTDVVCGDKPGLVCKADNDIIVATQNGSIKVKKLKLEGKKEMSAIDFALGQPRFVGSVLEQ